MKRYSFSIIKEARQLRSQGKTYKEIKELLGVEIPKSTLSDWSRNISLPKSYLVKINSLMLENITKARSIALKANKIKRDKYLNEITKLNLPIAKNIQNIRTAKIALAMLCLGEGSKSTKRTSFYFGNSDPNIIVIFLELLKKCFYFDIKKVRCTVQCRADQDTYALEKFWRQVTGIPKDFFYTPRIDPRTIGKPTLNSNYKGVLRIDYFDNSVRLELESLANLVYNRLTNGPVVYR